MIAIVDYGMGNLRSVQKALEKAGAKTRVVTSSADVLAADKLVLPGVGAMKPAMERLNELSLSDAIRQFTASGRPFLGICLGLQLLFDSSTEGGLVSGLGIVPGMVERFPSTVKAPQMGWNDLAITPCGQALFAGLTGKPFVYFCHSYYVKPVHSNVVAARADYGLSYAAAICQGNVWGVQFHPEKSQQTGAAILKNFVSQT